MFVDEIWAGMVDYCIIVLFFLFGLGISAIFERDDDDEEEEE